LQIQVYNPLGHRDWRLRRCSPWVVCLWGRDGTMPRR